MPSTSRSRGPSGDPMPTANTGGPPASPPAPPAPPDPPALPVSPPSDKTTMPATRWPRKRSRTAASAPVRSLRRASAARSPIFAGASLSPTLKISVVKCEERARPSSFFSSMLARATRVWPSASASRMLRETSTSTGTIASRDPAGGRITIGRKRNSTSAASVSTRRLMSTPRCTPVSRESGRRYSAWTTAATAAARMTTNHQGRG